MRSAGSVPTKRVSTPNVTASAQRTYSPKGSSPTFVSTAARCPRRAAATATFVAVPPIDLRNVVTCLIGTPSCSA